MAEQWKSYFSNVNDKLASIALDLALAQKAPISTKPWLLWVWVYMRSPRTDGLSDRAEFDALSAIEDELAARLGKSSGAIEVGRITTDGRREFYFYGENDKGLEASVQAAMDRFKGYKFDLGSQEEPRWNQYFTVLYPSEEQMELIKNQDVLEVLMKHGDTLKPVRDVHHWIYFRSPPDRAAYASEARELGYRIEEEIEGIEHDRPFGLIITRAQSVTPDKIDDAVIELFRLAKHLGAEYDGWEAQVIATKN